MTSADRLEEIADYARYLQGLHEYFRPMMPNVRAINLLGFSQGCATQVRWIMSAFPRFDHLVLWAGALPEDLDYRPHLHYFQEKRLFTVYGHADPFLTPDRLAMLQQYIERSGLTFHTLAFEGGHTIDRPTLARLKALLDPDSPEYENFP
jgi:predicted esterase